MIVCGVGNLGTGVLVEKRMKTWLILDVSNLAWRAFHTMGHLSQGGQGTGVVFGLLKEIRTLMDLHATSRIVFCFDYGKSKRKEMDKNYKRERHERELTQEEEEGYQDMKQQIDALRTKHLPYLGFKNIFFQDGYEGDDIIASVCKNLKKNEEGIIVSTDKDLWQLLGQRVCIWNPIEKVCRTKEWFEGMYGLYPDQWAEVKALMGKSKELQGINGVGEKYAVAYIKDSCFSQHVALLIDNEKDRYERNMKITTLPLKGTKVFKLQEDKIKPDAWRKLTEKLGMTSISQRIPGLVDGFGLRPRKVR